MKLADAAYQLIDAALAESEPGQGLWLAAATHERLPRLWQWTWKTPEELLQQPWQTRYDLAITCLPETLDAKQALHALSALRDLHARQVLAFVPLEAYGWHEDTLLGLGMQRQARFQQADALIEAWSFDIRSYKSVPDWLNPRFWANPENWNKYRW